MWEMSLSCRVATVSTRSLKMSTLASKVDSLFISPFTACCELSSLLHCRRLFPWMCLKRPTGTHWRRPLPDFWERARHLGVKRVSFSLLSSLMLFSLSTCSSATNSIPSSCSTLFHSIWLNTPITAVDCDSRVLLQVTDPHFVLSSILFLSLLLSLLACSSCCLVCPFSCCTHPLKTLPFSLVSLS